jgi:hypothetical protein
MSIYEGEVLIAMDQEGVDQLARRLAALERAHDRLTAAHRRVKRIGGASILTLVGLVIMGVSSTPQQPKTIEARSIVIRDSKGVVRGALGIADDGSVGINLNDDGGAPRLTLDVAKNQTPGLDLYDSSGQIRATLALGPHGTPGLGFYNSSGKLRTSLDIPSDKTPGLAFYSNEGKGRFGLP